MKRISAIHLAIMENMENSLMKYAPHILIRDSHYPISALLNSFHNIISKE